MTDHTDSTIQVAMAAALAIPADEWAVQDWTVPAELLVPDPR